MAIKKKKKWLERLLILLLPTIFQGLMGLILLTCRRQRHGYEHWQKMARDKQQFITTFWHYAVLYIVHVSKGFPFVAMVSASDDGGYVARVLEAKGFSTVRGSRNQKGLAALKGMLRAIKQKKCPVLVADGSQGPALIAQPGAIMLASRGNIPILPVTIACSRYLVFGSWDRTILPLPFSRLIEWYGEPITVPQGLDNTGLEKYRLLLEEKLNQQYKQAWQKMGREGH